MFGRSVHWGTQTQDPGLPWGGHPRQGLWSFGGQKLTLGPPPLEVLFRAGSLSQAQMQCPPSPSVTVTDPGRTAREGLRLRPRQREAGVIAERGTHMPQERRGPAFPKRPQQREEEICSGFPVARNTAWHRETGNIVPNYRVLRATEVEPVAPEPALVSSLVNQRRAGKTTFTWVLPLHQIKFRANQNRLCPFKCPRPNRTYTSAKGKCAYILGRTQEMEVIY